MASEYRPNRSGDRRRRGLAATAFRHRRTRRTGINVVGYFNHVLGLGESARQFLNALRAADVPYAAAAIDLGNSAPRAEQDCAPWLRDADLPYELTVLWCNPDRLGIDVDPGSLPGRLVGRWAWELERLPDSWQEHAAHFSEIWTASRFVRDAIRDHLEIPVRVIPTAIHPSPPGPLDRRRWGIRHDQVLFVFMFDHHSVAVRKNPLGLLSAFLLAFADDPRIALLIKTINACDAPQAAEELRTAAGSRPTVQVIDAVITGSERASLLAGCDCYVSLHRSEGFGMSIAEAMAYGRPVIATDYGGNVDYLDGRTGYPVRWTPARVTVGNAAYPTDASWAEPDIQDAAVKMNAVIHDRAGATRRGMRAARLMRKRHSPAAVGNALIRELARRPGTDRNWGYG